MSAENFIGMQPFQESMPVTQLLHTSAATEKQLNDLTNDSLRFVLEVLVPSIDSPVLAEESGINWAPNSQETLTNESSSGITWFYLELVNNEEFERNVLLEISDFDGVSWIYRDSNEIWQVTIPTYDAYLGGRVVFDREYVLPVELQASESKLVMGFVYSVSIPRTGRMNLWEVESFREQRSKQYIADGVYFGLLLAIVFYNFALFTTMRQSSYLYASLFQLSIGAIIFFNDNYSTLLLIPRNIIYTAPIYALLIILVGIFSALFSISILQIRKHNKTLHKCWIAILVWNIIQLPLIITSLPSGIEPNSNRALVLMNFFAFPFIQGLYIYTLIYFWKRISITKYWFIAVTVQVWALVLWQIAGPLGFSVANTLQYVVQIFTIVNGLVLTALVGYTVRSEQQLRAAAQEEALNSLQVSNYIQQSKSNFINATSHDLRQPLEAIRLHIDALLVSASDQTGVVLKKVENNISELSALLNSLTKLSKDTVQIDSSEREIFLLSDVLNNLAEELEPFVNKKNLSLEIQKSDVVVNTSKVGLTQILRNLLNNSVKYTDIGGIRVEVIEKGHCAAVRVIDSGCGIPEQELDKVFTEFYQLPNNSSDIDSGRGLGLSIVERLTKSLNMPIKLESIYGEGTSIELEVPLSTSPIAVTRKSNHPTSLNGLRVAIVHPDMASNTALKKLLEQWGAMALAWPDIATANEYIIKHNWKPDMHILEKDYYLELLSHSSKNDMKGKQSTDASDSDQNNTYKGLLKSFDTHPTPTVVLYQNSSNDDLAGLTQQAQQKNSSLPTSHRWFESPIHPGKLRSFIQQKVVMALD